MKKFQVTIQFDMDEEFGSLIPAHRTYINRLIKQGAIDHYVVTMETQRVWITITAEDKDAAVRYITKAPLYPYWKSYEVNELLVVDGLHYRLPAMQMN